MLTSLARALDDILLERERQDELWGSVFDSLNTPNDFVAFITRYVAEGAYDGRNQQYSPERFRIHLVKAAALCVAAMQCIDENGVLAPRHYEKEGM